MEKYVKIMDIPLSWRKMFCAFRISCHELEIEKGRYARPRKPPEDRLCRLCLSVAETKIHFMVFCTHYSHLRQDLFETIYNQDRTFYTIQDQHKFEYLMTSKNEIVIKSVMQYLYCALKLRKIELSSK